MVRSLWTAATGMNGQQANIDTISNNLSNVNTTGYKKQRVEFEDLLYQKRVLNEVYKQIDTVVKATEDKNMVVIFGAPLTHYNKLYNCAIVACKGEILGGCT